jgi:hypothetical protein
VIGGIIGWGLFAFTLLQLAVSKNREIKMIEEIKSELKIVKQEIIDLK